MTFAAVKQRRLGAFAAFGLVFVGSLGSLGNASPALGADPTLQLVSAPLTVVPGGVIALDVRVADGAAIPTEVDVSARAVSDSIMDLTRELTDTSSPVDDSVHLTGAAITVIEGVVHLAIPTDTVAAADALLTLPARGTYVLTVDAGAAGRLTVAIIRRSDATPVTAVPVTFVFDVDSPLSLQADGTTTITDLSRAEIAHLTAFLAAATVPVSVSIRPELLDSLSKSGLATDRDLVRSLSEAFGRQRLLSSPYLHIDPSVAADAGASADFTTQLRIGENTLSNALRRLPDRRVWVATNPLSPAGATLVRNLGAAVVIQAGGTAQDLASTSGPVEGDQAVQPVLVPSDIDAELARASDDPMGSAHRIAVELLRAKRNEARPSVVLMPDLATANHAVLMALTTLLTTNDSLQAVDVEQVGIGTSTAPDKTAPVVADFSAARTRRAKLMKLVAGTAGIIPTDDPRRIQWTIRADVLLDTRLADDERAAYETQLRADLLDVQNRVVLRAPKAVNLGDRNTSIPVTIENNNDVAVTVTVRLVGAKLRFPPTSDVLTVEPGETEFVRIPVSARSNGRFPVTAQLLAPGTKTVVGKPVVMNVRVGRLTGLGIVFTFAAGLILLTWWAQHLRRRWRKEETADLERRKLAGLPLDDFDDLMGDAWEHDPAARDVTQEYRQPPRP